MGFKSGLIRGHLQASSSRWQKPESTLVNVLTPLRFRISFLFFLGERGSQISFLWWGGVFYSAMGKWGGGISRPWFFSIWWLVARRGSPKIADEPRLKPLSIRVVACRKKILGVPNWNELSAVQLVFAKVASHLISTLYNALPAHMAAVGNYFF